MLLSDVAELYDLLVEYKGCTADYKAEKKPTAYAENGVIIVDHAQNTVTKKEIEKIIKSVLDYLK